MKSSRQSRAAAGLGSNGDGRTRPVLVTGGAGFIGTNLIDRLAREGTPVILYDNLVRPGVERNLAWLRSEHGDLVEVIRSDVRDEQCLRRAVRRAGAIFHFAAQVAVTSSLDDPRRDFDVNLCGTMNLLESIRACSDPPPLVLTSTNKVYGNLQNLALEKGERCYQPSDPEVRAHGISERCPLDFHSPYGCSKGAADQYVLDYARSYGLPTVEFRMSCIYGRHQMGTEDQGWVAHFVLRALAGEPITIYGDGNQVRDILFADDLVNALLLARRHARHLAGRAFNIGGGPSRAISLLGVIEMIAASHGRQPEVTFSDWRIGDQRYYVSDTREFARATGWKPVCTPEDGVAELYRWMAEELPRRDYRPLEVFRLPAAPRGRTSVA